MNILDEIIRYGSDLVKQGHVIQSGVLCDTYALGDTHIYTH